MSKVKGRADHNKGRQSNRNESIWRLWNVEMEQDHHQKRTSVAHNTWVINFINGEISEILSLTFYVRLVEFGFWPADLQRLEVPGPRHKDAEGSAACEWVRLFVIIQREKFGGWESFIQLYVEQHNNSKMYPSLIKNVRVFAWKHTGNTYRGSGCYLPSAAPLRPAPRPGSHVSRRPLILFGGI